MLRAVWILSVILPAVLSAPACPADGECSEESGCPCSGQIFAVLVAGSSGYKDYRHQADICHAYQVLHHHGVPDSNIVVMMYDDIAYNDENPVKGNIINKPGGPNVYKGVVKDYTGTDVTPTNFLNVLLGNSQAMAGIGSGKVLTSGPNDRVFINFVDRGGLYCVAFPNDGVLYKDQLMKTLKKMHKKKMFHKLLFYMESSDSGSMFNGSLPNNVEIMAVTASKPTECSHGCYWDEKRQAYVGDEFSVAWMEDIDTADKYKNLTTETLMKQFKHVQERVNGSHPSMYGFKRLMKDNVTLYFGSKSDEDYHSGSSLEQIQDSVSNREIALHTLTKKIELANSAAEKEKLMKEKEELIKGRKEIDELFARILSHVTSENAETVNVMENSIQELDMEQMPCYRNLVDNFSQKCVNINKNSYVLRHLYKFSHLCAPNHAHTDNVLEVFSDVCSEHHKELRGIS